MQKASDEYKKEIKKRIRNRGYARVTLGVINNDAQKDLMLKSANLTYYSEKNNDIFNHNKTEKIYATCEQDFSKLDGSMYFLPKEDGIITSYYNNGLVCSDFDTKKLEFGFESGEKYQIKGLTIDFGEIYPLKFSLSTGNETFEFENNTQVFTTETVFENVEYFIITSSEMSKPNVRFRIYGFECGVARVFTNNDILLCSVSGYVSPVSESLPALDVTVEINNNEMLYDPEEQSNELNFLEKGQEMTIEFGYDISGKGDIEWIKGSTCYLNEWSVAKGKAVFNATDIFNFMNNTYYKGHLVESGNSLGNMAKEIFEDAGLSDCDIEIDSYLWDIKTKNPIPPMTHAEAMQVIANAGMARLYQDRNGTIRMESAYITDYKIKTNGEPPCSSSSDLMNNETKSAYALCSENFSILDGSLLFMPSDGSYKKTGYISEVVSDDKGFFDTSPIITITPNTYMDFYGLKILFRNTFPTDYTIRVYSRLTDEVEEIAVYCDDLESVTERWFADFKKIEIEFVKNIPNARIFIDNILMDNLSDYRIEQHDMYDEIDIQSSNKAKAISIKKTVFRKDDEEKELAKDTVNISGEKVVTVYLTNPSYELYATTDCENATAIITDSSSYMATIMLSNSTDESLDVSYTLYGKEYAEDVIDCTTEYEKKGVIYEWNNPLISNEEHAKKISNWLKKYHYDCTTYSVTWRGDARVDAGDYLQLEKKSGDVVTISTQKVDLNFNGSWDCTTEGKRVKF